MRNKTRAPPRRFDPDELDRLMRCAKLDGCFSEQRPRLCTGCRQWVDVIWFIEGRKELCRACAPPDQK